MDTTKIIHLYVNQKYSIKSVASETGESEGKIKRLLKKLGITRSKSEAQSIALEAGRSQHPTQGKEMSETTKNKMSKTMRQSWENLPQELKDKKAKESSERWKNMDLSKKNEILTKAAKKVQETSKKGSKIELFVVDKLRENGYNIVHHSKYLFSSNELEIDILMPEEKIVIEIDGPSHFLPVYGEEILNKRMAADNRKSGLVINAGWTMIRVCYMVSKTSKYWFNLTEEKLLKLLNDIKSGQVTDKYIEVKINE